jgi:hypothetical protein
MGKESGDDGQLITARVRAPSENPEVVKEQNGAARYLDLGG